MIGYTENNYCVTDEEWEAKKKYTAFIAAALCGVLGFVQAEGFFVFATFLGLVGIIFRRGVSSSHDLAKFERFHRYNRKSLLKPPPGYH